MSRVHRHGSEGGGYKEALQPPILHRPQATEGCAEDTEGPRPWGALQWAQSGVFAWGGSIGLQEGDLWAEPTLAGQGSRDHVGWHERKVSWVVS